MTGKQIRYVLSSSYRNVNNSRLLHPLNIKVALTLCVWKEKDLLPCCASSSLHSFLSVLKPSITDP